MLKGKPLSIQIWLWFVLCIGISGVLIASIIYGALESSLKEQLFKDIESQQQSQIISIRASESAVPIATAIPLELSKEVKHFVKPATSTSPKITAPSANTVPAKIQTSGTGRYQENNTYYVVSEQLIGSEKVYIFSYKDQNVKKDVIFKFGYVFIGILIIMLAMLLPAHIIAKKLTMPLTSLKNNMELIAMRKWNKPVLINGSAELVSLAESCESMRQQLVLYDNKQQNMLQSISHDLKTPLMVIRNYIQATKDGFYPKGNLDTTLNAIDQEAVRLQKKVLNLIYITNLEYISTHYKDIRQENINLKESIEDVFERLQYHRTEIEWVFNLDNLFIKGDREHWKVVLENIIQNALRHTKDKIKISLYKNNDNAVCKIYNNGECIDESKASSLFDVYEKGANGESGLGLNIVKRIVDLYNGKVWFENEDIGVSFYFSVKAE